jgi:Spy/CpxP family protein refolding chaperone
MKSYIKIFAPVGLAILIGSLTFIFGQTKSDTIRQFPQDEKQEFGRMPPPPPFGFAPNGLNPRMLEQLNLTDEQKKQIHTLEENAHSSSEVYFEKLQVIQEKIKDTTEGESFDESAARKLLKTRGEIQTELEIIRLKTDSAIFNLLTAEQIAQIDLLKQQRPEFPPIPPQEK